MSVIYEEELEQVKGEAYLEGYTDADWKKWGFQTSQAVLNCGFRDGADVRRVALNHGRFER